MFLNKNQNTLLVILVGTIVLVIFMTKGNSQKENHVPLSTISTSKTEILPSVSHNFPQKQQSPSLEAEETSPPTREKEEEQKEKLPPLPQEPLSETRREALPTDLPKDLQKQLYKRPQKLPPELLESIAP